MVVHLTFCTPLKHNIPTSCSWYICLCNSLSLRGNTLTLDSSRL